MYPGNLTYHWTKETINVALPTEDDPAPQPIWAVIPVLTLSWEILPSAEDYREGYQSAYRAAIYRNGQCIWESGKVEGYETSCRIVNPPVYQEDDLSDSFWTVTLWDQDFSLTETGSGYFT